MNRGLIEDLFDPPVHRGVEGTIPRRGIVDAVLWLARTGCRWQHLRDKSPVRRAVRNQWRAGGLKVARVAYRCGQLCVDPT